MSKYPAIKWFQFFVQIFWTCCRIMQIHALKRKEGRKLRWLVVDVCTGDWRSWRERAVGAEGLREDSCFTSSLWVTRKNSSQRLPWRDDYIMAALFWVPAKRQNTELAETESQPRYQLTESPHSCNSGSWLVTATIIDMSLGFRDIQIWG